MRIVVLGAGAVGLALAYLLQRQGTVVTVVEAAPEPGGLLATFDAGRGHRLERFYHHFFTHDAEIRWLLDELGLASEVRFRPTTMGLLRDGSFFPFDGPRDLLRLGALPLSARLRFAASSLLLGSWPGYLEAEDRSALEWFRRWAGPEATEGIWAPLLRVKFGDQAERIPLAWMAGRLRQRMRSRRGSREHLGYLQGSLQRLVDGLTTSLKAGGTRLFTGTPATGLILRDGKVRGVDTPRGPITGDAVIATLPPPLLAPLVRPFHPSYAAELEGIEYLAVITVVLALAEPLSPVYWLNVADPGHPFGAVIEQTRLVPAADYGGRHLLYLSRYLTTRDELWQLDDDALWQRCRRQLESHFGRPLEGLVRARWTFRARHAAALCDLGFGRRVPAFHSPLPGLHLATMCHIYPDERSVNNSIRVAAEAVRCLGLNAAAVPRGSGCAARYGFAAAPQPRQVP